MKSKWFLMTLLTVVVMLAGLSALFSPLHSDTDARDGWGIVTDQNGNPKDNETVTFYKWNDDLSNKTWYCTCQTGLWGGNQGCYTFDIVTGCYDILVREDTPNEGGYIQTYLQSGQWPNLRRDIKFGNLMASK